MPKTDYVESISKIGKVGRTLKKNFKDVKTLIMFLNVKMIKFPYENKLVV